jgi:hypothetical protein
MKSSDTSQISHRFLTPMQRCGEEEWPAETVAGSYAFLHALYQQVVYQQLPVGRRMQIHPRIGMWEEAGYRERASERAAELAVQIMLSPAVSALKSYAASAQVGGRGQARDIHE